MKRKFGFVGRMNDVSEKRKKGRSFGYLKIPKGVEIFQLEKNSCKIEMDILPYKITDKRHPDKDVGAEEGVYWFKRPFKVHRNVGVNHENIICPKIQGKPCPICEYKHKLYKSEGNEEEISELRISDRNLYAVVIKRIENQKFDDIKIQLFEFSDYLFQEVMEEQLEDKEEFETFALPDKGSTLQIRFSEDSLGKNKYPKATRFELLERDYVYDDDILDLVPNLDECLTILDYDEIKNIFFNVADGDEKEGDEEPEPEQDDDDESNLKRRLHKKVMSKKDTEKEDEEPEKEEEEESKPRRRSRKSVEDEPDTRCPFGHKFGVDYDQFEDCDECDVWRDCRKENK